MKKVLQSLKTGVVSVIEIPSSCRVGRYDVVIQVARSAISPGAERSVIELGRKSLIGKARHRPDEVRRVFEQVRQEGLMSTWRQVQNKLDEPIPLGYSSAGVVFACGDGVEDLKPGDRVASDGPHASVVSVPKNLCAKVPGGVSLDHAAFAVLGSIALQGVRLAQLDLGGTALVIGLGLAGQLTVALLRAAGVRVIGTDPDASRCELALEMGASEARPDVTADQVGQMTNGLGADAVLIAAATTSKGPMDLAAGAVRKKGRIVLVGFVGLELDRRPFYFKECEFVVSCSYGPGRYDPSYEERGQDYPAAYVRWTEQRNIQAVLDLMASGALDISPLISHKFPIDEAEKAYDLIEKDAEPCMGVLLEYPEKEPQAVVELAPRELTTSGDLPNLGVIGAGTFARAVMLPAVQASGVYSPRVICSLGGLSAVRAGKKHGFLRAMSDEAELTSSGDVDTVMVLTRHDQHARQVVASLEAGKHVFVEKPLGLTLDEVETVESALAEHGGGVVLMVGFNLRFSPAARMVKDFFMDVAVPLTVSVRMNAGVLPPDHWTQDADVGGGRIIGEACHAIDLATFLVGSRPVRVFAQSIGGDTAPKITDDQVFITLRHDNGSISNVAYLSGGDKAFPKERVEVIGGGRVAVIDDFKGVTLVENGKVRRKNLGGHDKGHRAEVEAFAKAIREGGSWPISWAELRAVSIASILAVRSLREGVPFEIH